MARIGIINYDSGNLRSVTQALTHVGAKVRLVGSAEELAGVDAVVLPGVGSFGDAAKSLRARELWNPLREWLAADKPFLGICLGYQLLFETSEETPDTPGFGILPGKVVRFADPTLKIPHMGWNSIQTSTKDDLWTGLPDDPQVFFVHSYYPEVTDPALISSRCAYGIPFAASARRGHIRATQFHPEKSQQTGLQILANFLKTL